MQRKHSNTHSPALLGTASALKNLKWLSPTVSKDLLSVSQRMPKCAGAKAFTTKSRASSILAVILLPSYSLSVLSILCRSPALFPSPALCVCTCKCGECNIGLMVQMKMWRK